VTQLHLATAPYAPTDRDAIYTPSPLAVACVERLVVDGWLPASGWVVEPSVGGGAFARVLSAAGYQVVGVEHDPQAEGGRFCSLYLPTTWEAACAGNHVRDLEPVAVVGNPPFGGPHDTPTYVGARHALLAVEVAPVVALLLPAAWVISAGADNDAPADLWRKRPPWVVYPVRCRAFGNHLREVALFVWGAGVSETLTTIGRPIEWRRS
jgi:hypothetical protein